MKTILMTNKKTPHLVAVEHQLCSLKTRRWLELELFAPSAAVNHETEIFSGHPKRNFPRKNPNCPKNISFLSILYS